MRCLGYPDTYDLADGETLELLDGTGTALRIARGMVWITMERDTRDIVLAAGDTFVIDRPGLTLIAAQAPTTLCAMTRGSKARPREPRPGLAQRAIRWLESLGARRRTPAVYY